MIRATKRSNKYQNRTVEKQYPSLSFVRQDKLLHQENHAKEMPAQEYCYQICIKTVHPINEAGEFYEDKIQQVKIA